MSGAHHVMMSQLISASHAVPDCQDRSENGAWLLAYCEKVSLSRPRLPMQSGIASDVFDIYVVALEV